VSATTTVATAKATAAHVASEPAAATRCEPATTMGRESSATMGRKPAPAMGCEPASMRESCCVAIESSRMGHEAVITMKPRVSVGYESIVAPMIPAKTVSVEMPATVPGPIPAD
jgi:hypothetical protein